MIRYDKLVRDRIPEIIAADGKRYAVRVMEADEYTQRLRDKLVEEFAEFQRDASVEELLDLVEIVQSIVEQQGLTWDEFEHQRLAKRQERGGFTRRLLLEAVWDDTDD